MQTDLLAIGLAALIALVAPLRGLDEEIRGAILGAAASGQPFTKVFVVTAGAEELRGGGCGAALARVIQGGPRALLLAPPADALCALPADAAQGVTTARVSGELLTTDGAGAVLGLAAPKEPALSALGIGEVELLATGPAARVPAVRLADLAAGRVDPAVVAGRIVVAGADDPAWSATYLVGGERTPLPIALASAIGAQAEGGASSRAPRLVAGLLAGLLAAGLLAARQRLGRSAAAGGLALCALGLHGLDRLLGAGLLPEASLALGLVAALGAAVWAARSQVKATRVRTADRIHRSALLRPRGTDEARDEAFWDRLATLAAQAGGADGAAVYERVGASNALALRAARGVDPASLRAQMDLQAPPFGPSQGGTAAPLDPCLVGGFAGPGEEGTALLLPLTVDQSVVGCVALLGASARRAFEAAPTRAAALAGELSLLAGRRRAWAAAPAPRDPEARRAAALLDAAALGAEDRRLFAAMLERAPVGLLFADALGDVRVLGGRFVEVLSERGVRLGSEGGAPLRPGTLSLAGAVSALTGEPPSAVAEPLAALLAEAAPLRRELSVGDEEPRSFALEIRSLRGAEGDRELGGYVGTLVETTAKQAELKARAEALGLFRARAADIAMAIEGLALFEAEEELKRDAVPRLVERAGELMDTLESFAPAVELGEAGANEPLEPLSLINVARSALALSGAQPRAVTLDAPVAVHAALGRRGELLRALRAVLDHTLARPSATPLLLTIREWRNDVELLVIDPAYGAPGATLAAVEAAPERAPSDLLPLADLLLVARRAGGEAHVLGDAGTGATVTVRLRKPRAARATATA